MKMVRPIFLIAALGGFALASVAPDNRATLCKDIESCDFDQQCVDGTCKVGQPSQSGNSARSATTQSALICTPETCRTAHNYISNSDLAVLGTYWSPALGVGVGGAWVEGWTIEGIAGIVVNPLQGAGGVGWRTNEVALRAYWADGGFSYILENLPVGRTVTVQFMFRDSQGTYVCTAPSVYVLYLEVDNYPKQTFRVTPRGGKRRESYSFIATDSTMKIRFSAEKDAFDGCGPFFSNVQAVA